MTILLHCQIQLILNNYGKQNSVLQFIHSDHDYISVVPTTDDKLYAAVAKIDCLKCIITYNVERYAGSPDLLIIVQDFRTIRH